MKLRKFVYILAAIFVSAGLAPADEWNWHHGPPQFPDRPDHGHSLGQTRVARLSRMAREMVTTGTNPSGPGMVTTGTDPSGLRMVTTGTDPSGLRMVTTGTDPSGLRMVTTGDGPEWPEDGDDEDKPERPERPERPELPEDGPTMVTTKTRPERP